ncbi:MAG: aspartate kinase [Verrucomicrobia bacterium]|nr:aspartate kinase [Verrucomicrobiota bacterium]
MTFIETIVLKFGGASVASTEQFSKIADIILNKSRHARVVVVVSAMGDTTDQLLSLARRVHPSPPPREQDMLVSVGERISVSLLAMALQLKGSEAISFTGSQSGIITSSKHSDAGILDVRPHRILKALDAGKIVIVAGFQGVSKDGEITTLGRGGSDTSAVALGVALGASKVEFYKDVEGVYSDDPKTHADATFYPSLSFDKAIDIVQKGAKVLHPRCIRLAAKNGLPLHVLSFYDPTLRHHSGTLIGPSVRVETSPCVYEGEHG